MNRHKLVITTSLLVFLMFSMILSSAAAQAASAEDIEIVDLYSSIDSADVTLHSGAHHTNITIDADLILDDKVLRSKRFIIDEVLPDTDITRVVYWEINSPAEEEFYTTKMTLSVAGSVRKTRYCNFSYGGPSLPRVYIEDIIPDSRGVSVILSPYRTIYGTQAVLVDVEYMLVNGDTVIYRTTDQRVDVVQTTPLSEDWNVRLENNHPYSARVKIKAPSQRQSNTVIARSVDFTADDDARITELYRDETGASATVLGLSQVPFTGEIVFTVSKDGETIEEIREKSPILMSDDDETTEVIWDSRLPAGMYELSVKVIGNDGDVVDILETVIEAEERGYEASATATTAPETPGFNVCQVVFTVLALYLLRRNR
ncbi:MAG: hypothetical protein U9N46_00190 [Euryarchaeota archaeon]|nr:MAG: hypothetical protein C5S47_00675 [ANME-2 cluster archaeon]MEA1863614.1 hypothetical protein [Euryarchaeota archaeon]